MLAFVLWYFGIALVTAEFFWVICLSDWANYNGHDGHLADKRHVVVNTATGSTRPATKAEVYGHYNRGRSYSKDYKELSAGVFVFSIVAWVAVVLVFVPIKVKNTAWAEPFIFTKHPRYFIVALLTALFAIPVSFRPVYGFCRWKRLNRKLRLPKGGGLTADESAGYFLSEADNVISIVEAALIACAGLFAYIFAFTPAENDTFENFERVYGSTVMCAIYAGIVGAVGLWALIEHLLRKKQLRNNKE